jgi:hypothetical protein
VNEQAQELLASALEHVEKLRDKDIEAAAMFDDPNIRQIKTQSAELRCLVACAMLRYQVEKDLSDTRYAALMTNVAHNLCVAAVIAHPTTDPAEKRSSLVQLFARVSSELAQRNVIRPNQPAQKTANQRNGLLDASGKPVRKH